MVDPDPELLEGALGLFDPPPADQQIVEDQTEGIDVGPLVDALAHELLGRHVLEGADDPPRFGVATGAGSLLGRPIRNSTHDIDGRRCRRTRNPEIHDVAFTG